MHLQTNFSLLSFSNRAYQHYVKLRGAHDPEKKKEMALHTNFSCHKHPVCSIYCWYYMCEHLRVQGRYTTDPERVRDYSLLGIDLHVLYYFCIYLTRAYFLHGFLSIVRQSTKEHRATPWERTFRSSCRFMQFHYARSGQPKGRIL